MASVYLCGLGWLLTSLMLGTQVVAQHFRFAKWLGAPLLTVLGLPLYLPLKGLVWFWKYYDHAPAPFDTALLVIGVWSLPWVCLALWLKKHAGKPQTFGTQDWGTRRDMQQAGLFADTGPILGRIGGRYLRYKGPKV